ncbi:uncharacterized protein [Euwallacea fornicatus]|uniref:uncharacterized protein n=1 Tax=Euwallacea fornicatus TaxID=995702 RepID=UPI00338F3216
MTESDGKNPPKVSTDDWEEICIRPSIDLIPDEYEREKNSNLLVELVADPDDKNAHQFLEIMGELGYQVNATDVEDMKEDVTADWMAGVVQKVKSERCDGIIMVFSHVTYNTNAMKEIWSKFTSRECPELKNKPKIFIFLVAPRPKRHTKTDFSQEAPKWSAAYETPSEADMLIIQDKLENDGVNFLLELTTYIETHGDKEDIITLASVSPNSPPLLISTMTRKFYVKLHQHRGYHLDIRNNTNQLKEKLDELHQHWFGDVAASASDKPKRTGSVIKYLKKKFSTNWKKEGNKMVRHSVAKQGESSKKNGGENKASNDDSKDELDTK